MYMFAQADVETDEVYAQMTLQPVSKVGQLFNFNIIIKCFFRLFYARLNECDCEVDWLKYLIYSMRRKHC